MISRHKTRQNPNLFCLDSLRECQFIILKLISKEKELNIYLLYLIWTVPLSNRVVDERKFLVVNVFQLINEEGIIEVDHHLATSEDHRCLIKDRRKTDGELYNGGIRQIISETQLINSNSIERNRHCVHSMTHEPF